MSKVIVIGGGAAGMFAANICAGNGHEVILLEKNEKLGKKIYITGKGRCNLTNACDMEQLFEAMNSNPKFLYSSFYGFTNQQAIDYFENIGLRTKIERGDRVFPVSDHSSDVIRVLEKELKRQGVEIRLYTEVKEVIAKDEKFECVILKNGDKIFADNCIITTGGMSYQTTGSTGDGYKFARKVGHTIVEPKPALVPIETAEEWVTELQGLSLRNVSIAISRGKKKMYEDFGEMLFTHFGVSGPLVITASSKIGEYLEKENLIMEIDLKPALSTEQLDARILRDFDENHNKKFQNSIGKLYPSKLVPVIIKLSGIDPDKKVNEITKAERQRLVMITKKLPITLVDLRGFNEAIITKGGIKVSEIDPGTMESKIIKNLFFAGEVLDLDGKTGGFNLQIAWSTAYAAANGII